MNRKENQASRDCSAQAMAGGGHNGSPAPRKGHKEAVRAPPPPLAGAGARRCAAAAAGASGSCQATEVQAALAAPLRTRRQPEAVTVSLRSLTPGTQPRPARHPAALFCLLPIVLSKVPSTCGQEEGLGAGAPGRPGNGRPGGRGKERAR